MGIIESEMKFAAFTVAASLAIDSVAALSVRQDKEPKALVQNEAN